MCCTKTASHSSLNTIRKQTILLHLHNTDLWYCRSLCSSLANKERILQFRTEPFQNIGLTDLSNGYRQFSTLADFLSVYFCFQLRKTNMHPTHQACPQEWRVSEWRGTTAGILYVYAATQHTDVSRENGLGEGEGMSRRGGGCQQCTLSTKQVQNPG